MVSQRRSADEARLVAWRMMRRELARVRRLHLDDPGGVVVPSRLVAASAGMQRLRRYANLLDWRIVEAAFAELVDDELPGDVTRWFEPLEPVA